MRITPPRAGSFMDHAHLNEICRMSGRLWGPFIVLEPGEAWNSKRDYILMAVEGTDFEPVRNGGHDTLGAGRCARPVVAARPGTGTTCLAGSGRRAAPSRS
jgi:hypothetical protein